MTTVARRPSAQDTPNTPAGPQGATCQGERGFTLIELSIVLVIIGLLIGGVLQGQEMINSTRLKTTVAQIDAITAAVQTFEDKYRGLPGDALPAVSTILGGTAVSVPGASNGNGVIEAGAAGNVALAVGTAIAASTESALVFNQLGLSGLLQSIVENAAVTTSTMDAKIGDGAQFDVATYAFTTAGAGPGVRIRTGTSAAPTSFMDGADAFSLDQRYDDGVANSGRWEATGTGATCASAAGVYAAGVGVCMPIVTIR